MLPVLKLIVVRVFKNLVAMLMTKTMLFWALEKLAEQSKTSIDDNAVALIKAAYDNDEEGVRKAAENILSELK